MIRSAAVAIIVLLSSPTSTWAQSMEDYLSLSDSYCTGSGGSSSGITCRGGTRDYARERLEREIRERRQAELDRANKFEIELLAWLANYDERKFNFPLQSHNKELMKTSRLSEAVQEKIAEHYSCLQSSLFAVALAEHAPHLYYDAILFLDDLNSSSAQVRRARIIYYHIGRIFALSLEDRHHRLSIEDNDQAMKIRSLLANEIKNTMRNMIIRMIDFKPSNFSGIWKQESILFHIGFHPGSVTRYDSPFARQNCYDPSFGLDELYSASTVSFIYNTFKSNISLAALMPPENYEVPEIVATSEEMIKFSKRAFNRNTLFLSDLNIKSKKFRDRLNQNAYGQPKSVRFVELQAGDPIPKYSELLQFGFPLNRFLYVVPSFDELLKQPDISIIRLLVTGGKIDSFSLSRFIETYERDPEKIKLVVGGPIALECRASKISHPDCVLQ